MHVLVLIFFPSPHVTEQGPYSLHSLNLPLTGHIGTLHLIVSIKLPIHCFPPYFGGIQSLFLVFDEISTEFS